MMDKETKNIVGLLINLVIPGVGTIIWGDSNRGITQLVLFLVGLALCWLILPGFLVVGVWIWALVDGIKRLTATKR
jgi:hypothetical protein